MSARQAAEEAETARKCASIKATADKQLSNLYNSIKPLQGQEMHKFFKQLKRQAVTYGWPPHIMTEAGGIPDLTDDERDALDEDNPDDLETLLHIRNAYVIVTAMCDDHEVSHLLEGVPEGRARQALDCIRNYFYPNSTSGRRMAYKTFVTASMTSTHNTIVEWSATVRRNAPYLRQVFRASRRVRSALGSCGGPPARIQRDQVNLRGD